MAEYILRSLIEEKNMIDSWKIESSGIAALDGEKANIKAIEILLEQGIDLSKHLSKQINKEIISSADLILTMTRNQKEILLNLNLNLDDKIYTLKEFVGEKDNLDIYDPFGQSLNTYRKTRDEIWDYLNKLMVRLNQISFEEGKKGFSENNNNMKRDDDKIKIAIGSDHAGFSLKEEIKQLLEEEGFEYEDMGTDSTKSVDYPDFAYKLANSVASGKYERGILICGTGIGMSISANKIKGIRAALCHDVFSARASRNHNNSNILTMGSRIIGPGLAREITKVWLSSNFDAGRHERRVGKINLIERDEYKDDE
jgi:ribose 5-phosphate isomerase B